MLGDFNIKTKREVDARTFQPKLNELATTIALKVQREGVQHYLKPEFVAVDIYFQLLHAQQSYNFLFFVNADDRRKSDCDWRMAYSVVSLPVVRTMVDCLYNVATILQDPGTHGYLFRASGYRRSLEALDADEERYGTNPEWADWIARQRREIDLDIARTGLVEAQVRASRYWPTLGSYLNNKANASLSDLDAFLKKFTLGFWQEYSSISHATFQGLKPIALFLQPKDLPHDDRPKVEALHDFVVSVHIARVAAVLACMLTEVQAYCRFSGARIGQRLHEVWNALLPIPEVRELYDGRYAELMNKRGIFPTL